MKSHVGCISIAFHGQNYCFMWNFYTWKQKWQNLLETAKYTERFDPRVKCFVEVVHICALNSAFLDNWIFYLLCNKCPKFGSVPSLWISKDKLHYFWGNLKLLSHYCRVTDNNVKLDLFLKLFLTAMTLNCTWNCQFTRDPQEGNSSKRLKM